MATQKADVKGRPFSIRLSRSTDLLVEAESARTRRSKSAVVESLTEEAARMRRFPGIAFRGDDAGRRPWIVGTGLDVWELNHMIEDFPSSAALIDGFPHITERHIQLALAYRQEFPAEIDQAIAENRRSAEELAALYPFVRFEPPPK